MVKPSAPGCPSKWAIVREKDGGGNNLLRHVLSFVLDQVNYLNLILVCKEWQDFVNGSHPLRPMHKIWILTNCLLNFKRVVFHSLLYQSCPLYNHIPASDELSWPELRPEIEKTLYNYVYKNCKNTRGMQKKLYDATHDFLQSFAFTTINAIWSEIRKDHMDDESNAHAEQMVIDLLWPWYAWSGIVNILASIFKYRIFEKILQKATQMSFRVDGRVAVRPTHRLPDGVIPKKALFRHFVKLPSLTQQHPYPVEEHEEAMLTIRDRISALQNNEEIQSNEKTMNFLMIAGEDFEFMSKSSRH